MLSGIELSNFLFLTTLNEIKELEKLSLPTAAFMEDTNI